VDAALPVDWSDLELVKLAAYTRSAPPNPFHGCGGSGVASSNESSKFAATSSVTFSVTEPLFIPPRSFELL
jgi:hypothetical protein